MPRFLASALIEAVFAARHPDSAPICEKPTRTAPLAVVSDSLEQAERRAIANTANVEARMAGSGRGGAGNLPCADTCGVVPRGCVPPLG
jgi:hypothetical protein